MDEESNGSPNGIDREAVQRQLEEIVADFELLGSRLRAIHSGLPVSPREDLMLLGEEDPDYSCIVRGVIECALNDHFSLLVKMLLAAARSETKCLADKNDARINPQERRP